MNKFPKPIGAVWMTANCLYIKLNQTLIDGREVKVREKHIAIRNSKKKFASQPDYFLHVYQKNTGANPEDCFIFDSAKAKGEEISIIKSGGYGTPGQQDKGESGSKV